VVRQTARRAGGTSLLLKGISRCFNATSSLNLRIDAFQPDRQAAMHLKAEGYFVPGNFFGTVYGYRSRMVDGI
jgi:hypothetical protein